MIDTKTAIRMALEHAIEDRVTYLDAIKDTAEHDDVRQHNRELIKVWTRILRRRYWGPTP